jgi:uncharacterized protein YukE
MTNVDGANLFVGMDLESAGRTVNAKAQAIADELYALIQQLLPLGENWASVSASWYEGLQSEWNYAANGLFGPDGVLGEIANALQISWNNYSEAEWANTNTWNHA